MSLANQYTDLKYEAGVDEAGRGPLAGPVVAAAVILPTDYTHPLLNDSKQLSHKKRLLIREEIIADAIAWNIGIISAPRIDEINIYHATFEAMHEAVDGLKLKPEFLLIDGNRFKEHEIPHECIIKGDGKYLHIAAASILAKTCRDEIMEMWHREYPEYGWDSNKGYPTRAHKEAIRDHGITHYHRKTFNWRLPVTLFD